MRADRAIVHEVAGVVDLRLVEVGFLKNIVLKVLVRLEDEGQFEAGLFRRWEIGQLNIDEVLQCTRVALCDKLGNTNVVA